MKSFQRLAVPILAALLFASAAIANAEDAAAPNIPAHLQAVSVTVRAGQSSGSGVVKTRDGTHYIWTAGHVVAGLRHTRKVLKGGSDLTVVEFSDPSIVQKITDDKGKIIGEYSLACEVIRYSEPEQQDLALLRVRKRDFLKDSATFHVTDDPLPPGTELYHVGSLLGDFGSNSLTEGIVSQVGRTLFDGIEFDQTTATAYPGSSGGGMFTKDGKYAGMLVRGAGESFNLMVPARRIKKWAEKVGVTFAIDDAAAVPSEDELDKTPIEDSGSELVRDAAKDSDDPPSMHFHPDSWEYPTLEMTHGESYDLDADLPAPPAPEAPKAGDIRYEIVPIPVVRKN